MITTSELQEFATEFLEDENSYAIFNTQTDVQIEREIWSSACEYFELENVEESFGKIVLAVKHSFMTEEKDA